MKRSQEDIGRLALRIAGLGILSIWITGATCAQPSGTQKFISECTIESDQINTVISRWPITPIPITFRAGQFSQSERDSFVSAAKSWNEFYVASQGYSLLDADSARTTTTDIVGNVCSSTPILDSKEFLGQVKIYKRSSGWAYDDGIIAITTVCSFPDSSSSLRRTHNAMLESNHENFYVSGKRKPDLESIFLHEFGHLVGLDHSCTADSVQEGVPDCNVIPDGHPYDLAVLFPTFKFFNGSGELKRVLTDNDMGRANCLYE